MSTAINLKPTEIKPTETAIINFPTIKPTAKETLIKSEIKVLPWVNDNSAMYQREMERRNLKAKQYINSNKRKRESAKETIGYFASGFCLFAGIFAAYFLLCLI